MAKPHGRPARFHPDGPLDRVKGARRAFRDTSAPFAPSLRALRLTFTFSSLPRRRASKATRTIRACRPGSRIRSGMTKMWNAKSAEKRRGRKDKYWLVTPAKAGVQRHTHKPSLPPWIPDHGGDKKRGPLSVLRAFSAPFAVNLYLLVSPAKAGVQGHTHKSSLPPWTPDQVRDDKKRGPLSVLRAFSAPFAVTLYLFVSPAKAGVQGHTHKSSLPPWIPDQVRDDAAAIPNTPSP